MNDKRRKLRDGYIWLMNMASHYYDCEAEDQLKYIDFKMHIFLCKTHITKWRHKFNVEATVWKQYLEDPNEGKEDIPFWFVWVAKWFMHGLNGPFGSVSLIPKFFFG